MLSDSRGENVRVFSLWTESILGTAKRIEFCFCFSFVSPPCFFLPLPLSLPSSFPLLYAICPAELDLGSERDCLHSTGKTGTPVLLLWCSCLSCRPWEVPASSRFTTHSPHLDQRLVSLDSASYSLGFCFYRFASPLSCRTLAKSSWEFHPVITSTVEKKQEPLIVALRSDAIPPNGLFNLAPLLGGNTMTERRKPIWPKCIYLHLLTGLGWGWDRKACLTIGSNWDNCGREVRIWKDWLLRHTGECHTTGVLSTNTFILVYWGWTEIKSWES